PPGLRFRQTDIEALPGVSAVLRAVGRRLAAGAGARPHPAAVHREHPGAVVVARVDHHRETDVADRLWHRLADAHPGVGGMIEAVDAAVVLLVEPVRVGGAHPDA